MKYELDEDAVAIILEYVEEALVEIAEALQHQEGKNFTSSGQHLGRAPRFALIKQFETFGNVRNALHRPIRCKDDVLAWPVEKLGLCERILRAIKKNCVEEDKLRTVGELVRMTEYELSKYPNLGKKSIHEIKDYLAFHGLYLSD